MTEYRPNPWNEPESYEPEAIQRIRARLNGKPVHVRISPSLFATLAADAREAFDDPFFTFSVGGVIGSLLVCVLAFFWSAL